MYKPVLSIDVFKSKSCAAAFLNYRETYLKPFSFNHSPEDAGLLVRHLESLEQKLVSDRMLCLKLQAITQNQSQGSLSSQVTMSLS